ncbi:hypothetical protein [Actinomadura chokoriensis]|uniref:Uncharacterized protein n=1 Tax=Actinomadura chokoriensis TaxID=454156 RepID=A0ABV4R5N1_9ACTN
MLGALSAIPRTPTAGRAGKVDERDPCDLWDGRDYPENALSPLVT